MERREELFAEDMVAISHFGLVAGSAECFSEARYGIDDGTMFLKARESKMKVPRMRMPCRNRRRLLFGRRVEGPMLGAWLQ